jgi:hypothetical protein
MKKLLLILLCLPMIGFGQGWEKIIDNNDDDVGYSVQQTTDGGYIMGGRTKGMPSAGWLQAEAWLIKTDDQGIVEWINDTYNSGNSSTIHSVQQTLDGGYIAAGCLFGTSLNPNGQQQSVNDDVWLIKTNSLGDTLWTKLYKTEYNTIDRAFSVQQTLDGGYIMSGTSSNEIWLIKTDFQGDEIWNTLLGPGQGTYVQQTSDGGYIVAGTTGSDAILIKTNSLGDTLWTKKYGGTEYDYAKSVQQTPDGGYILTCTFQDGDFSFCLIKIDNLGVEVWNQKYEGPSNDYASYGDQTDDGGYFIFGETTSQWDHGNGGPDFWFIKTNSLGDTLWTRTIGSSNWERGYSAKQTADGGYILVGLKRNMFGDNDLYLVKLNSSGNTTSSYNIQIKPNRKLKKKVDLLGKESKPKKNIPFIEIYDDGTVEKKIIIE